jgi:trimethylamine--corrinoid protein Co-methyltransferase
MIVDAELIQMLARTLEPIEVNEDALGLEAMKEAGAGGHFFGTAHTQRRYETEFYTPLLSDWRNFENWQIAGALDATQRANAIYKTMLENYVKPPMDPAIEAALQAYVARRRGEIAGRG